MAHYSSMLAFLFCISLLGIASGQNAPEILVAPSAMHVDYGSTVYMACVAYVGTESQSIGVITQMNWYNPHSQLLSNNTDGSVTVYTTTKTQDGQFFMKSILKICNFTSDDFGRYMCRITNIYGQNEKSWIVSIVQLPISPQLLTSPTSLTTTAGKTIYMSCSAYGYPYPAITWRREGQVVQSDGILTIDTRVKNYNGANISVSTIKICGVDSEYVGSYTCTASVRDIGQVVSNAWRLDVSPVPIISSAPENHTINYGVTAYMSCTAYLGTVGQRANQLSSTLSWLGPNSQQLVNTSDSTISVYAEMVTQSGQVFMKSYLKICNFTGENSGQYSCAVSNANGRDNRTWVASLPYPVTAPQLVAIPSNQTVRENNAVYMSCAFYGYPFPEITWYRNGQVIDPATTTSTLTVTTRIANYNGAQVVQSDFKICFVGVEDSGIYTCRATTRDLGMVSSPNVALNVLPIPAIIVAPKSQDVTYGVTFYMSCAAHVGNTAQNADQLGTTLTWRGPNNAQLTNSTDDVTVYTGTMISPGGHVIIRSVIEICGFVPSLEGTYSCTVSNANGQDVRMWNNTIPRQPIAPTVVASPTTQTISEGNSVIMACSGYGYPYPRITWYRNSQPLDPNSAGRVTITTNIAYYYGAPVTESILKICGAAEEDHGSYYCSFSSAFGSTVNSDPWQVNVSPAPTIVVAPQDNEVEYSSTVYMTCAAYVGTVNQNAGALTTTFTWLGPDSQALNDTQVSTDTSTQNGRVFVRSILRVCDFGSQNAGQYTCRVGNANGNENRTWMVRFPQTPVAPQLAAISGYESVTYGHTVYMACAMYGYPQPQISWTRDNTPLSQATTTVTATYVTVNNVNITQSFVRVCGFQSENMGTYLCTATNQLGTTLGYVNVISEAPEIIASPSSRMVNYGHAIYMSCIAYIGRMNKSVDQLATTFSWWDSSNRQLTNSSDGSVSVYTNSSVQNGLVFMSSVLKICNFTQSDTGEHTCTAMNTNGQGSASWNLTFLRSPLPPQFLVTPPMSTVTSEPGHTVYMDCAAYGFPTPWITWSLNGQVIYPNDTMYRVTYSTDIANYGGAQVSQSLLKICGVGEEDIGNYSCTATTSKLASSVTSSAVTLNVMPVPTLVVVPTDQEVTFGKTTLMTCVAFVGLTIQDAENIPTSIIWLNPSSQKLANRTDDSVSVYTRTQIRGSRVFIESILKMCDFTFDLEGSYSCSVTNANGGETRSWNVSLHQETFEPTVIAFPVSQSSRRYGYSVLMACAAYGYPPPIISFNQRGQPINQAQLDGAYNVTNNVMTYANSVNVAVGILEICGFDYDDIGNYSCTATSRNVGQVSSPMWTVGITAAPFLVSSPMSQVVSYDTRLQMTCIAALGSVADSRPTTISWFDKNGTPMNNNSVGATVNSFMYTNATENIVYLRSDAVVSDINVQYLGELSCVANNSLGSDAARWNITSALDFSIPQGTSILNNSQIVDCSAAVSVVCTAWGYPPPDIIWTINEIPISTSKQVDTIGLNSTNSRLVISQFNMSYSGAFVCNASNHVGSAKSEPVSFTLNSKETFEIAAPTITSSRRTNSDLALVEFKPVSTNTDLEFQVSYYAVMNSSGTPNLDQLPKAGSVQSKQTQVSLTDLDACTTYWATVSVVNSCGVRRSRSSSSTLIGLHDVMNFQLLVTLPTKPCTTWINEDASTKIGDVTAALEIAASTCGITLPCPFMSSQWQCQNSDPQKATFSTNLVGDEAIPTMMILTCINQWIKDAGDSTDIQIDGVSYAVGLMPVAVGQSGNPVNTTAIGIAVVVVVVVIVGIIIAVVIAVVILKGRNRPRPVKKEKLEEDRNEFGDVYSRHSFAVVENPLFADHEQGDDTSYTGETEGYEYDSGTLDNKEDLGAGDYDDDDYDEKAFI